ncbi:MAG: Short-chain dehydrogenase [Myxococcaceae bacterium]|nr:Short-chain dehydrogenase [Myxococcaceae bacterium]
MVSMSLEGKVAIVTGASRGIGEAIAHALAQHGAKVVLASRKLEGVQAVADAIGASAFAVAAHTGREDDCKALVAKAIDKFGKVDILINNAATNPYFGPLLSVDAGAWDKTFEVNLKGYFYMAREVAQHLIARSAPGSIVSVASVAGVEAAPLQGVYGMTKAAVISMTKTLAYELASSKIRVNSIAPGLVKTRFAAAITENADLSAEVLKKTPLGRTGTPDEIAAGALFLASDAAGYLTGHCLVIDGGMTVS